MRQTTPSKAKLTAGRTEICRHSASKLEPEGRENPALVMPSASSSSRSQASLHKLVIPAWI
jgi:hypothetical protein